MHYWGDEGVDWDGINAAASFISQYCIRYGRLGGSAKEKYGTVRFSAHFGSLGLHTLIYPGYAYNQFPDLLWHIDYKYISPFMSTLFGRPFAKWQEFIYNRAYQKALKLWPHLRAEILVDADYVELIKGVTKTEDNKTHIIDSDGSILATWEKL